MKKMWESLRGWLMLLLFFIGLPSLVIAGAVYLERSQPIAAGWLLAVFAIGPYFYIIFDGLYGDKIRKKRHLRGELAIWETELKAREAAAKKKEAELAVKENDLNEREAHIDDLVKEKILRQAQNISHRDYLKSTLTFQNISTDVDAQRFLSSMTQDITIHPPFNITAEIHSKSGGEYKTSLQQCTCLDFKRRKAPCKHMYRLAAEFGALSVLNYPALRAGLIKTSDLLREQTKEAHRAKAAAKRANTQTQEQPKKTASK